MRSLVAETLKEIHRPETPSGNYRIEPVGGATCRLFVTNSSISRVASRVRSAFQFARFREGIIDSFGTGDDHPKRNTNETNEQGSIVRLTSVCFIFIRPARDTRKRS